MFKTEKDFGKFIMQIFKSQGYNCMRIESASTITGCPDLWVQGMGDDFFIELKNHNSINMNKNLVKVQWRQGQQAWGLSYMDHHHRAHDNAITAKVSWTFVATGDDYVIMIPMNKVYPTSTVNMSDPDLIKISKHDAKYIPVLLRLASYRVKSISLGANATNIEYINCILHAILEHGFVSPMTYIAMDIMTVLDMCDTLNLDPDDKFDSANGNLYFIYLDVLHILYEAYVNYDKNIRSKS